MATRSLVRNRADRSHRAEAVQAAIADVHPDDLTEGVFDAVAMTVADAAAADPAENETLRLLADQLDRLIAELHAALEEGDEERVEAQGRLLGYRQVVHWVLQRAVSDSVIHDLNPRTHAYAFLRLVDDRPGMSNSELMARLGVSESEVSRVGRRIYGAGLAQKRRIGGVNYWEVTPRGKRALEVAAQRFDLQKEEQAPALEPVFNDIAALLVGALLEADVGRIEARDELETEVATTTGEMLKSAGVEVEAKPDLAVRFLDTLDSELYDIWNVVNGSKHLVEGDVDIILSGLGKPRAKQHGVLLTQFKFTPEKQLSGRDRDLRLAKANDGTWLFATRTTKTRDRMRGAKKAASVTAKKRSRAAASQKAKT
jgi:DNA-binding MarR family transcriptional regulator